MKKEYIVKEAAINYLTLNMNWYDEEGGQVDDWDERKVIISDLLDGIPPADVKPVIYAHWVSVPHKKSRICSHCACDEPYKFADENADVYNFCPNYGSNMRKEVKVNGNN